MTNLRAKRASFEIWRWLLYGILIARLTLALITVAQPSGGVLTDSKGYLALARGLIQNGRYGVQPDGEADLLRPPAYSGFLALVESTFGSASSLISLLQLTMSSLTSWLLVLLGRELERPSAGLVAGWLYALSPNVALWSITVMTEISFAMLLAAASLWLIRQAKARAGTRPQIAGLWLGLLAYLRPIAMTLAPVWALVTFWAEKRTLGLRKAIQGAAFLILVVLALTLPWAYRNWATYGSFTFSTATSKTLVGFNLAEVVAQAEGTDRNRAVSSLDPSKGLLRLTAEVASQHPVIFVKAQVLGVMRSLTGADIGTWGNVLGHDDWEGLGLLSGAFWGSLGEAFQGFGEVGNDPSYWTRTSLWIYSVFFGGLLVSLSTVGVLFTRPASRAEVMFFQLALGSSAILLLIPGAAGQARFRVPAEPYLATLAGYGAVLLAGKLQGGLARLRRSPGGASASSPDWMQCSPSSEHLPGGSSAIRLPDPLSGWQSALDPR